MKKMISKTFSLALLTGCCFLAADGVVCHTPENIATEVADKAKDAAARAKIKALELAHRTQEAALKAGEKMTEVAHDIKHQVMRGTESPEVVVVQEEYQPVKYAYEVNQEGMNTIASSVEQIDRAEQRVHEMRQRLAQDIEAELNAQRDASVFAREKNEDALQAIDKAVQAIEKADREIHEMRDRLTYTTQVVVEPRTLQERVYATVLDAKHSVKAHPYRAAALLGSALLMSAGSYRLGYTDYFNYYSK